MNTATDNLVQHVEESASGGIQIGSSSSSLLGFFGTTPAAKVSVAQTAVTAIGTTTLSAANTSAVWGFASSTAGNALVTRVGQIVTDLNAVIDELQSKGLIG